MRTDLIEIDPWQIEDSLIELAGERIAQGQLVAFPTETVYGLGGNALDPDASKKIYSAKGRPSDNPLIVHIADKKDMEKIARNVPTEAYLLAEAFWPGPLTIILRKQPHVPMATTGGLDTVAIRMPDHPIALELIRRSGCPIAAPSANTSGRPSPTLAEHVREDLEGKVSMIVDGGEVGIGIESTIIDLSGETPMILRPGFITPKMLSEVLHQEVCMDPAMEEKDSGKQPKAPGMKYRHYAPKAGMVILDGEPTAVVERINSLVEQEHKKNHTVAVIATEENQKLYHADYVICVGSRKKPEQIAKNLYRILRECDDKNVDMIYSECFDRIGVGMAIMNRLLKAAAHSIIRV